MLRTNQNFLDYIQKLYDKQNHKDNIILNSYKKGENLFLQGQKAIKIMIIKSGISKCYFFEENDKEYILEFLGKGEIIGEIEAVKKSRMPMFSSSCNGCTSFSAFSTIF